MILRKLAAAVVLCAAVASPAAAQQEDRPGILFGGPTAPNFFGTTGLLLAPSAYTLGDKGFSGHFHGGTEFYSFGGAFGLTDRLEVGLTWLESDGFRRDDDGLLGNAKFALLKERLVIPQVAVGITDAFDQLDLDPSWYVVASKEFLFGLRAHLGYGDGIYDDDIFAGLEWGVGANPSVGLIAEYVADDFNIGARARFGGFSLKAALFDFDEVGFGISYTGGLRL